MKMDTILCSIDGRPEITNRCRGANTYERIMENVACIKAKGYSHDLVARMTVSVEQEGDIYEEVMHIILMNSNSKQTLNKQTLNKQTLNKQTFNKQILNNSIHTHTHTLSQNITIIDFLTLTPH